MIIILKQKGPGVLMFSFFFLEFEKEKASKRPQIVGQENSAKSLKNPITYISTIYRLWYMYVTRIVMNLNVFSSY